MRPYLFLCFICISLYTRGSLDPSRLKDEPNNGNVFIITLDGFRWQELFKGADSALLHNPTYTRDTAAYKQKYWHQDEAMRKQKLMPFFWSEIAGKGQLFGNREHHNRVDVSNIYRLSYPGYNEILTGKADLKIFSNERKKNRNRNLLEHLNEVPAYTGKIAAFTSWNLFSYILNKDRSNLYINCTVEEKQRQTVLKNSKLTARMHPHFYDEGKNTRNDWLTFSLAQQYIKQHLPKVLYLGLGGTDEYGHQKKYGDYLQQAASADKMIGELWQMIQSMPFYKNNTTFIITTDHGRGGSSHNWHKHGFLTQGSSQTWLALLGKGIAALGEHRVEGQLYQRQLAGTIGSLLGIRSFRNEAIPATYYTVAKL